MIEHVGDGDSRIDRVTELGDHRLMYGACRPTSQSGAIEVVVWLTLFTEKEQKKKKIKMLLIRSKETFQQTNDSTVTGRRIRRRLTEAKIMFNDITQQETVYSRFLL